MYKILWNEEDCKLPYFCKRQILSLRFKAIECRLYDYGCVQIIRVNRFSIRTLYCTVNLHVNLVMYSYMMNFSFTQLQYFSLYSTVKSSLLYTVRTYILYYAHPMQALIRTSKAIEVVLMNIELI